MTMTINEKKALYTFGCPNRECTVKRFAMLASLAPDPAAKRFFIDGWSYFSNPRMFAEYGRQKGWKRENPATDTSNAGENPADGFVEVTEQMELPF